ncbi:hypothetical protein BDK51DRAFT_50011 [Blyttiomyces helicus]|uniref:Uncharacterized protein n=1 Tax=Blyttiomyces helicus TaxID=388810 RepID=A0A4P9WR05_9FUNG|nr:hypothetical protein BDK51DRAFT_50011 [Blyttiomyces helicus]|eukprot:RKO93316.1 hypothetical protein BDK51DRAFT_50011 [Blyttiomyces helicus]
MKFLYVTAAILITGQSALADVGPVLFRRRFGQEQAVQLQTKLNSAIPHCQGFAASAGVIGGGSIGTLLAAADPCNKLKSADAAVAAAKAASCDAEGTKIVLEAAMDLVHGEKNFNPFVTNLDGVCLDASLPVTPELRGIPPLVDPRTTTPAGAITPPAGAQAAAANANAATTAILNAAKAAGKGPGSTVSVAQQLVDIGFPFIQNAQNLTASGSGAVAVAANTTINATATDAATATDDATATATDDATAIATDAATTADSTATATAAAAALSGRTVTITITTTVTPACAATSTPASAASSGAAGAILFTPAPVLGLQGVPLVRSADPKRQFQVAQDTFVGSGAACGRVGDKLFNLCANALNAGQIKGHTGSDIGTTCAPARDNAKSQCLAAVANL